MDSSTTAGSAGRGADNPWPPPPGTNPGTSAVRSVPACFHNEKSDRRARRSLQYGEIVKRKHRVQPARAPGFLESACQDCAGERPSGSANPRTTRDAWLETIRLSGRMAIG